jgi:hypothetical protein
VGQGLNNPQKAISADLITNKNLKKPVTSLHHQLQVKVMKYIKKVKVYMSMGMG